MSFRSLVKKAIPAGLFPKVEPYGHWAEAVLAQLRYGFPARRLKVIGVTGTDGKTTTCTLITAMLRQSGYKVAMMTTISVDYGDGRGEQPNPSRLTTLGAMELAGKLRAIRRAGAEWLVLETTSQALSQHRVWAVPYTIAVMTNVSHEHLDYHGSFEKYRDAKKLLFEQCDRNLKGLRAGIINADDPSGELFALAIENPILYGVKQGGLRAADVRLTPGGSRYTAHIGGREYRIICHLPGSFNVYNSLAAVGVGHVLGLREKQVEQGIAALKSVEGRMTPVDAGQDFGVIIDYAHTPDSFQKIFTEVRPLVKNRLIVVFGSAGRRDEQKRPRQGEIAGQLCDVVIVTEEDDRDCDGQAILREIAKGAEAAGKVRDQDLFLVHEREAAIQTAVNMAGKGDMVLLLGKGHEKSILTNGEKPGAIRKRPYDELVAARAALQNRPTS